MFFKTSLLYLGALTSITAAISGLNDGRNQPSHGTVYKVRSTTNNTKPQYLTPATEKFYIMGDEVPQVDFDVGESYAGSIPLQMNGSSNGTKSSGNATQQEMFFWFFPTVNPAGRDDIVIWLNGGPGCSSLAGLLQETGPFNWKPGTYKPIANAWSFHKLANTIWVEFPIGTGFSDGPVTAMDNDQTAAQFLQFFHNFVEIFQFQGKNVYITGESFAGVYIPFIGAAMAARNDTSSFNLKGTMWYNGVLPGFYSDYGEITLPAFLRYWDHFLPIDPDTRTEIEQRAASCGNNEYLDKYLTYPPPPAPFPPFNLSSNFDKCQVTYLYEQAVELINPCYNPYHISDYCPELMNVVAGPGGGYTPDPSGGYFDDSDVRSALHVPASAPAWSQCATRRVYNGSYDGNYNESVHAARIKSVIEHTNNVIIGSGLLDTVVGPNVTALSLQALEWNGQQGFQTQPSDRFVTPTTAQVDQFNKAGTGYSGTTHTERGLTFVTINLAGHEVPQYQPAAAFRHLEVLLGRVKNLSGAEPWSVGISTKFTYPF